MLRGSPGAPGWDSPWLQAGLGKPLCRASQASPLGSVPAQAALPTLAALHLLTRKCLSFTEWRSSSCPSLVFNQGRAARGAEDKPGAGGVHPALCTSSPGGTADGKELKNSRCKQVGLTAQPQKPAQSLAGAGPHRVAGCRAQSSHQLPVSSGSRAGALANVPDFPLIYFRFSARHFHSYSRFTPVGISDGPGPSSQKPGRGSSDFFLYRKH